MTRKTNTGAQLRAYRIEDKKRRGRRSHVVARSHGAARYVAVMAARSAGHAATFADFRVVRAPGWDRVPLPMGWLWPSGIYGTDTEAKRQAEAARRRLGWAPNLSDFLATAAEWQGLRSLQDGAA